MRNNKLIGLVLLLTLIFPVRSQSQITPGQMLNQPSADSVYRPLTTVTNRNSYIDQLAQRQLIESSLTLLENKNQLIPFQGLDTLRIAALSVGSSSVTPFQKMLGNYTKVDYFNLSENFTEVESNKIINKLKGYNLVITGIHSLQDSKIQDTLKVEIQTHVAPPRPYGGTENLEYLLSRLSMMKNSAFVFFSNPRAINEIKDFGHPAGLIVAYQNTKISQELAAQLIFGGIGASGKLPGSIGNR